MNKMSSHVPLEFLIIIAGTDELRLCVTLVKSSDTNKDCFHSSVHYFSEATQMWILEILHVSFKLVIKTITSTGYPHCHRQILTYCSKRWGCRNHGHRKVRNSPLPNCATSQAALR